MVRHRLVCLLLTLIAPGGCGDGVDSVATTQVAPSATATADLSSVGKGPDAAIEALALCFGEAGFAPVRLEGRTGLARAVGAGIVGSLSAQIGNSPVNIFEVATTAREAAKVRDEARRRGLQARAVERVWYTLERDWVPADRQRVARCLARVADAT